MSWQAVAVCGESRTHGGNGGDGETGRRYRALFLPTHRLEVFQSKPHRMLTGGISVDVGDMQTKLSRWAEQDKARGFEDLFNLLYDGNWLRTAQVHGRQNAGSRTAGCDGVVMRYFEEKLAENLKRINEALKSGGFEPQPVRRTYIREINTGGRVKRRPLGIPAIRDRIVQEALRMVLEPIWEADFSRHSYGFRPNRRTKDAVAY
jgi:RNA-directed DNA polymerase